MSSIKITNENQDIDFRKALYDSECGDCGAPIDWEASFDADGTSYYAECCEFNYSMHPNTVTVSREGKGN